MQNTADSYFIEILFLIIPPLIIAIVLYIALFVYIRRYLRMFKRFKIQQFIQIENERKRIANDLHDFVAGKLLILKSDLNEIIQDVDDVTIVRKLHTTLEEISEFHEGIRSVVEYIYPRELLSKDVMGSFKTLASEMSTIDTKVIVEFDLNQELQNWQLHQLFRITQEKIANIITHLHPPNLVFSIHDGENENECELTFNYFVDFQNSNSFIENKKSSKKGRGLFVINERLNILNAKYKFDKFNTHNQETIIFKVK